MTEKIRSLHNGYSLQPVVVRRGQVCTKEGLLETSEDAVAAIQAHSEAYNKKVRERASISAQKEMDWKRKRAEKESRERE